LGEAAERMPTLRPWRGWNDRSGRQSGTRSERRPLSLISETGAILGFLASPIVDRIKPALGFLAAGRERRLVLWSSPILFGVIGICLLGA
jgi:hypothetical protein